MPVTDAFSRVEVIGGVARRRRFPPEQKVAIVAETLRPGMSISYVARRHGLAPSLVLGWRRLTSEGGHEAAGPTTRWWRPPVSSAPRTSIRLSERMLGRKTMEAGILKARARSRAREESDRAVGLRAAGRLAVKTAADTPGVARSNVIERMRGARAARAARAADARRRSRARRRGSAASSTSGRPTATAASRP